jgi:hypothetical protein
LFKGGVSDHAYGHQTPVIDENLPGMNPSIMPKVEANLQSPASSGEKVGGWWRMWIIELLSLFLIVVLRAGSVGSLLVQVEDGEREGCCGGGGIWGKVVHNIFFTPTIVVTTPPSTIYPDNAASLGGEGNTIVTTSQLDVHALPTALVSTDHSFKVGPLAVEVVLSTSSAGSLFVQVEDGEREGGCGGGGLGEGSA